MNRGVIATDRTRYIRAMADEFDVDAMIERFKERATAVRNRPLPPIGGDERKLFLENMQRDFMDFAIIGDTSGSLENGVLTLTVDLSGADE